jgi:hypothetical protein
MDLSTSLNGRLDYRIDLIGGDSRLDLHQTYLSDNKQDEDATESDPP